MMTILSSPCMACPYRRDVASGVWANEEYDKLPPYDAETSQQPFEPFACHASPEHLCHGWAVCHSNRGHNRELIALRLVGVTEIPQTRIPLFASGQDAADHGKREIREPGAKASTTIERLLTKHERLRMENN